MAKERKFVTLEPTYDEKGSVNTLFAVADDGTAWVSKYSNGDRNVRAGEDWTQIKPLPVDHTQ